MKVVVAGATGLIGGFLLNELENDPSFHSVRALTRKEKQGTRKINWMLVDYNSQAQLKQVTKDADIVFCCLGTTMKTAGSKEAFRKVDYDYVVHLALAANENKVRQFSVISAMGADSGSKLFYNQVKGEMEEAVGGLGFSELIIFQPSLLLGPREETRIGEKIGTAFSKLLAPLMVGPVQKYRPIHVSKIAKAMIREAKIKADRSRVLRYEEILEMSK